MSRRQPASPFELTMRLFTLCWAVWIARDARILVTRSIDGDPFVMAAIAYVTCVLFLLLPPRWLAKSRVVALCLGLPFVVWWSVTLVGEMRSEPYLWNSNWCGILWLMTGSFIQGVLVWHARRVAVAPPNVDRRTTLAVRHVPGN